MELDDRRGSYGHSMRGTYPSVGARVVWENGSRAMSLCLIADGVTAWDGADAATTHALYDDRRDAFVYVELAITGRGARTHTGGVYGTKARMRFTGADDAGEWTDVVVVNADAIAETVAKAA